MRHGIPRSLADHSLAVMSCVSESAPCGDKYFAGLLDGQLAVHATKAAGDARTVRVTLACDDERVFREVRARVTPARETIVRRPGKKDACVALVPADRTRDVLEFAAENCVLRGELAKTALKYLDGDASADDIAAAVAPDAADTAELSPDWVSGYFDVRGSVAPPPPEDDDDEAPPKRRRTARRGVVKLVLPKTEKGILPRIQDMIKAGRVKKSSPCRLVFESKEHLDRFVEVISPYVRAKRGDLRVVGA